MIKFVRVCLKELSVQGKDYQWIKPPLCPSCNSCCFWGHGFLATHFTGFVVALWLKRYRCNSCKVMITMRPSGYFSRFQSSAAEIADTLLIKIESSHWSQKHSRQRAGQWLRRFIEFIRIQFGDGNGGVSLSSRLVKLHTSGCKFLSEIA